MFKHLALLAVAAASAVAASDSTIEADLLRKVVEYEKNKAALETELLEIQKIVETMNAANKVQVDALSSPKLPVVALATGSGSHGGSATVGSSSGGDDFAIETPPVPTSAPPATSAPAGSGASGATVTTAPTTTTTPAPTSAAVTVEFVAPVAFAAAAAAFTLL